VGRGKSPRTLETYRGRRTTCCCLLCEREGIDSATKIKQRFLDRLNAELLDSELSPASVRFVPPVPLIVTLYVAGASALSYDETCPPRPAAPALYG
jgi:hypothetical protein